MDAAGLELRILRGELEAEVGGARARSGGGLDVPAGRLWGQIVSRGEAAEWGLERRPPGSAMAAQCDPLSGYLPQPLSDLDPNSERSPCSPVPGSEGDSAGLPRPLHSPEWGEERFRVGRRKLAAMLQAAAEGKGKSGEDFFRKIMEETNTQIVWPSKFKIGAKSRKAPYIKVSGKKENVKEAKEKIMSALDTKSNQVTLKMDVSHTEHARVIGKGGNKIKKVIEETGCYIHFYDSRKNNQAEKSNQVSIVGQPAGVESARVRIRELLPLVLRFELPIAGTLQPIPDPNSPSIHHICQMYNISVSFQRRSPMYGATVIVRESQNNTGAVKEGTAMLLEHLAGSLASAIPVSTQLDIAARHHLFMMGRNGSNIKHIMQMTGAQIYFPDPSNPQNKSTVYLQGAIESVCLARQYLMGCLPLVLMFDMKEEIEVEPQFITQLMEQLDVFISIKPKAKQPGKFVNIKSVERKVLNMYEARKRLLGLDSSGVTIVSNPSTVSCPVGLSCPGLDILSSAGLGLTGLGLLSPTALSVNTSTAPNSLLTALNSSVSPLQSPSSGMPSPTLWATSLANANATGFPAIPRLMTPSTAQATLTSILLPRVPNYGQNAPSPPGLIPVEVHSNGMQSESQRGSPSLSGHVKASNIKYAAPSATLLGENVLSTNHNDAVRQTSTQGASEQVAAKANSEEGCNDAFIEVGMLRSLSHSANTSDLKQMMSSSKQACAKRQTVELLQGSKNSHLHTTGRLLSNAELCASESPVADKKDSGSEWAGARAAATQQNSERACLALEPSFLSMQGSSMSLSWSSSWEHLGSGSESDTWRDWNGLGPTAHDFVSSTGSPKWQQNKSAEHYLSSSNYVDCTSLLTGSNDCNLSSSFKGSDLPELLSKLGLGKYTDIFQQQEIDLQIFLTLTDQDLKELGITTFGVRRKMLLAISELNKNQRKLFDPSNVHASFLEGGSSGRLPRQYHSDIPSVSGCW